jgi:hypothetical protein
MKKAARLMASALLLTIALNVPAYGWGNVGHMAVAFVAYRRLKPRTRARADNLVKMNPFYDKWLGMIPQGTSVPRRRMMLFMIAATWADQIKGDPGHHDDGPSGGNRPPNDGTAALNTGYSDTARHKYWHFINLPFTQDGTALRDPAVPNVQTQIDAFRAVLASDSDDALKSYDMVWLLHLVGDVHQPLHCATRYGQTQPNGDDGGNLVNVCVPPCGSRLHGFWDELFGSSMNPSVAINVGQGLPQAPAMMANDMATSHWIQESFAAAKNLAYKPPIGLGAGPFTLTPAYRSAALNMARKRVALGGARLANILNKELK